MKFSNNLRPLALVIMVLFTLSISNTAIAQDPEFTQFYSNPTYLNPAFAGTSQSGRVGVNFRSQWAGIDNPFRTFSASYDNYVSKVSGGLGLQFIHDDAGDGTYHSNSIVGIYSYQTQLNRKFNLNAGAKVGYTQRSINWSEMTFGDMIDPDKGFVHESKETQPLDARGYLDLSSGVLLYSKEAFAGVAVHHLTKPMTSLIGERKLDRRYSAHAGANITIRDQFRGDYTFSPNILYTKQGEFEQLNMGLYFKKGVFTVGAWYRSTDAIIVLFGVKTSKYSLGYSYDMTISRLSMATGGAHEISLIVKVPRKIPRKKYQQIPCTEF